MKIWYPEADLVIKHPKIYTVAITCDEVKQGKEDFPVIEDGGVAAKDGKIIAVGTAADMEPYIGPHTDVIGAEGLVLTPGFVECHMHALETGVQMRNINCHDVTSRAKILDLVKEKVATVQPGEWVVGNGWNELVWADDQSYITRRDLDEIAPDNPVVLTRSCFHVLVANSLALEAAGIDASTPDPEGGIIEHYDDGEPNGLLHENSAMYLVLDAVPALTLDQRIEGLELVGARLNELGITSVIDANLTFPQMRTYLETKKRGKLSYRANLMFYLDPHLGDPMDNLRRLEEMDCVTGFGDAFLKMNGIKVTLDGIPATYTAYMREGYKTRPDYCGSTMFTEEQITAFARKAAELGWQFGIHTIGDACADMALRAYQKANEVAPIWDSRWYLIHYQFPQDDQWPIMRDLNVGVCLQPTIVSTMGEAPQFYEEQALRVQSPGLMFKNGVLAGGSSDSPVVSPDPMMGMYYAITRLDETTGDTLSKGDESKVTRKQALIMWTKNAAFFSHDDDKMGSVEVGNFADLCLFDHDFLEGDIEDYRTTKVFMTILDGKVVYERK